MTFQMTNAQVIHECDYATDEDVSVFIPVATLRRLVASDEKLQLILKGSAEQQENRKEVIKNWS